MPKQKLKKFKVIKVVANFAPLVHFLNQLAFNIVHLVLTPSNKMVQQNAVIVML